MTETVCGDPHCITPISEKILSLYRYMLGVIYDNPNGFWVSDYVYTLAVVLLTQR